MVSLLSSVWDQVVPTCSSRQAETVPVIHGVVVRSFRMVSRFVSSHSCATRFPQFHDHLLMCSHTPLTLASMYTDTRNTLGCYMVKSHGQLVLVS